jgi:serine/threonine-protein kinase
VRLGQYEILQPLGAGGMGVVYRGHDSRLHRDVAVKVLRAARADDAARARLWREARAAAAVNHPAVCQIYDVGEIGSDIFLVMELVNGTALTTRLQHGAMPFDDAIEVTLGILDAVGALHDAHIVHRDLKPSNVFLTSEGIKLLDFGLARSHDTDHDVRVTDVGIVIGTPRYMAPEQWTDGPADPRSDLFAIGALLFEMLTGRPAFPGDDLLQVYHAVMSAQPPALGGSSAIVAADAVIHRALEKSPDDRYRSASSMAQALRTAVTLCEDSGGRPPQTTRRLAVLPFRQLRPDPDLQFLCFSLPDAIVTSLAGLQSLVVRSAHVTAAVDSTDVQAVAEELGVDAVVCGTLVRADDQVRLSAQLLTMPAGTVLWSLTEQVPLGHLFDMQDHLARTIVESLAVPLSTHEQRRMRRHLPASARAYEYYLRANQVSQHPEQLTVAEALYRSALEEDSGYAPAWARLGRVYRLLAKYGIENATENLKRAEGAFARALALDPDLSAAHNLYTYFEVESLGRPKEAMTRLLARLQTSPADPELFAGLVLACRYCGLLEASLAADRQARRLDPAVRTSVAYTHFLCADWLRALEHDLDEARWVALSSLPMLGRETEALAAYRVLASRPLPPLMRTLASACQAGLEDRHDECLRAVAALEEQRFDPEGLYFAARLLVRIGARDRALGILASIVERGFFAAPAFLRDPWLDPIRREPHFAAMLRRAQQRSREAEDEFRRLDDHGLLVC